MKKAAIILFILIRTLFFGQTLGSNLDKDRLPLGETGVLKIKVFDLQGKDVESAPLKKLLPFHFQIIKDSISKSKDEYERTIFFKINEEGIFHIPPLDFKIDGKIQKTVPYRIQVFNPASSTDEISDIMPNKEIKLGWKEYWEQYKWYLLGLIIVLGVIFLLYQAVKYGRKQKNSPKATSNKTLKELDALKRKKYIQTHNFRAFYVELIEIMRNFLTEQYLVPANVLLTDDLLRYLHQYETLSAENQNLIEETFTRGDLVKFAKTFPTAETMEKDFSDLRRFVKESVKELELENQLRKNV